MPTAGPPTSGPGLRSVEIAILDTGVWSALAQGRIQPLDLLTSRFARVLVRVFDGRGVVEEFARSVPHDHTIDEVLAAYRIKQSGTRIEARPLPRLKAENVSGLKVFPGMVIEVHPDRRD
ncbi:MAG: hypothetical protein ACK5WM_06160 [Rhodospirillales bacterium]